ncbi:hypothetical protein [Saccharothrix deserti]|uniref:hypothetical protein n=1 Tax=Saccharothrix deserti TaxID=2593674 RepID=UPI00131A6CCB|nr:hypothetical protein [Saccharothrix deserti]
MVGGLVPGDVGAVEWSGWVGSRGGCEGVVVAGGWVVVGTVVVVGVGLGLNVHEDGSGGRSVANGGGTPGTPGTPGTGGKAGCGVPSGVDGLPDGGVLPLWISRRSGGWPGWDGWPAWGTGTGGTLVRTLTSVWRPVTST